MQPDELDIALAIDRMQRALAIEVRRVERSWAGLRTFTPDGSLAFGWDASAPGPSGAWARAVTASRPRRRPAGWWPT
ncbi:MAG: hypothetical protein M3Y41_05670 [Pseudomonadota bacterium]|nr:hypothetical protein [Pseudomonadota bacterium]